jgi:hypothetical protein
VARLSTSRAIRLAGSLALIAFALANLAGCKQSLPIKDDIVAAVDAESDGPRLSLYDGTTKIAKNGTAKWPNTEISSPAVKAFTIKNSGNENLVLSNVAIVGSSASFGSIVQPVSTTLAPGNTIDFSVTFTPQSADTDYSASFVINSNDSASPSFGFKGAGHSTQWRGSITYSLSAAASDVHVAADAARLFWSYLPASGSVTLFHSENGGKSYTGTSTLTAGHVYSRLGIYAGLLHVFWLDGPYMNHAWGGLSGWQYTGSNTFTPTPNLEPSNPFLEGELLITPSAACNIWVQYSSTGPTRNLLGATTGALYTNYMNTNHLCYDGTSGEGGRYPSMKTDGAVSCVYLLSANSDLSGVTLGILDKSGLTVTSTYAVYALGTEEPVTGCSLLVIGSGNSATLHAIWMDTFYRINYSKASAASPSVWSSPKTFTGEENPYGRNSHPVPFVADASGNLMFFHLGPAGGLRITRSTDGGATWKSSAVDANNWYSAFSSSIACASSGSSVYLAYTKQLASDSSYKFILAKSIDGGATW